MNIKLLLSVFVTATICEISTSIKEYYFLTKLLL